MKKQGVVGLLTVAVVVFVACLGGCYLGIGLSRSHSTTSSEHDSGLTHTQFHQALGLSSKQEQDLIPLESKAKKREEILRNALDQANGGLAEVLLTERSYSPQVEMAVEKIHKAMAELQKATLEHLFEMEQVLTPEQYDKLLRIAGDSLPHPH